ncbi:metalloregulator ArsR/SmtB family transcription factor [Skermania sp. ID1734]|uniref:helix-turn-helix transcriptional regulator n=1 Tax=Skermania sp. ID1734 TaxID=2597516 RepID=UPI0021048397|nr:ArsR family transcriptional regulator [Skermania sp. ID1734]
MSDSWPRRRLLAILRRASEPLDAHQLARETGQHVTTVRFHLDVLTKESLVQQIQQPPRGRGRPRIGYSAVQRSAGYQELAQALSDQLGADPKRRLEAAVTAGRAWAAKVDDGDATISTLEDAKDIATRRLADLGFAPDRAAQDQDTPGTATIRITACPLKDLARTHSEVVCGVHLGLMREVLDRSSSPGAVNATLLPFIEPGVCIARLSLAAASTKPEEALSPAVARVRAQLAHT